MKRYKIYESTIEDDCAEAFRYPPYSSSPLVACMSLIHYDEWVSGNREGDISRIHNLAIRYGAKFKDVNTDMLFRAEYKMLKGPVPPTLQQLIYLCWDFSDIRPPEIDFLFSNN